MAKFNNRGANYGGGENRSGNFHGNQNANRGNQNGKNGGNFSGDNRKQDGNFHSGKGKNGGNSSGGKNAPKRQKPYAFMPLNEQILYPQDFGEVKDSQISFDKPFAHSQSGEIKFTIIAKSDIFVGDFLGKNSQNPANPAPKKFFKIGDKHAISGSSVRGVLRSIAEILSFAKLTRTDHEEKRHPAQLAKADKFDMSERIFGAVANDKRKQKALKSRVSFSHFIATNEVQMPKFQHPSYVIMDGFKKMKESKKQRPKFDRLSGFKIYTPQGKITPPTSHKKQDKDQNEKVPSTLSPLGAGSEFTGVLRYFNLTKIELGLLGLCLTALESPNGEYFYKFGGAKFYGYGDSHIKLSLNAEDKAHLNECIKAYKDFVRHADSACRKNAHANAKNSGFDLESRLDTLRKLSKIGGDKGDDTQNLQNSAQNSQNSRQFSSQNSQNSGYGNKGYNRSGGYKSGYDKGGSHNSGFGSKFDDLLDRLK